MSAAEGEAHWGSLDCSVPDDRALLEWLWRTEWGVRDELARLKIDAQTDTDDGGGCLGIGFRTEADHDRFLEAVEADECPWNGYEPEECVWWGGVDEEYEDIIHWVPRSHVADLLSRLKQAEAV